MDEITLRAMERILAVFIGGISVYLGYRLFINLPDQKDSEGKFILPGDISIYMSRVGPGVFFALFGSAVIALSFYQGITYSEKQTSEEHTDDGTKLIVEKEYSGIGDAETKGEALTLQTLREVLKRDISILNTFPQALKVDLSDEQQVDIELAIPRIKLTLMKTVWAEDWGDYDEFKEWARKTNALGSVPPKFEDAAAYYHYIHGGK